MSDNKLTPRDQGQSPALLTPLEIAGQVANQAAGAHIFDRYLSEKSPNTVKRHARDLRLFSEYLRAMGIPLASNTDFQRQPSVWRGVTWGLVEGFVRWQLTKAYAVTSVNARLSTVRTYAQLAVKAGVIDRAEGNLIASVKGYSRQGAVYIDDRRITTRKPKASYSYTNSEGRAIKVTRRSTKKKQATLLNHKQVFTLKKVHNKSEQAWRDSLLMCLLLEHGLRVSEVALLKPSNLDLHKKELRFFRPKVKGTRNEWTTHHLTDHTYSIANRYLNRIYPEPLKPDGPLILGSTRLLKSGDGGYLTGDGLNRVRLSERVAFLGKRLGLLDKLSAHDCRHTCATHMAQLGYGVDELMAWFGWTSAQTAMRYVASADVKERHRG